MPVQRSYHRFGLLNLPITKYGEDYFKRSCEVVVVVVESCCCILVLVVMVTVQQNFSAVANAVAMASDCWPSVILSAEYMRQGAFLNIFFEPQPIKSPNLASW